MPKIVDYDKQRSLISRAACRAIAAKGIGGVTMIEIANEAGVTTGMILNYFKNKEAIIAAALRIPFKNIEARINEKIDSGEEDLAGILEVAIPASRAQVQDVAAWVSFWGLIATDEKFRKLNRTLHKEGQAIYAKAMRAAWPETSGWPDPLFEQALRSIATFLFGLSAGGVTNPKTWTQTVQREQLGQHLELVRNWAKREG